MRKLIYPVLLFTIGIILFSCEEQEPFGLAESDAGFNLKMTPDVASFDISKGDPAINFAVYSNNTNIEKVTILVDLMQFGSGGPTPKAVLTELAGTSLKSNGSTVSLKLSDFVKAVGLQLSDLAGGDIFTIHNVVKMNDGRLYPDTLKLGGNSFVNVENSFFTAAGTTTYTSTLSFPVLCPFVSSEAVGTYTVVRDDFETYIDPNYKPKLVEGPGPNQVTFKNLFGHPEDYDIIITVDPVTDVATVAKQPAWHCANFGCGFGEGSVEGTGFFFSCTGFVTLDLKHTVAAGSFGTWRLELSK